jgi:arylsulfatase A
MGNRIQTRREFFRAAASAGAAASVVTAWSTLLTGCRAPTEKNDCRKPPNFVIIWADDMGYGDWGRAGHPTIRTPNLNRMADQGITLTQFYSGHPLCSPSRSALLTGRNPIRTGVIDVFIPGQGTGMPLSEITLAEALKPLGYKSVCIGKWHLGSVREFRPLRQGFDYHYGLLYSNESISPDLWRNDERIEHPSHQATLTKRYTEEAIEFLDSTDGQPFFLYLPHTMPHVPLAVSESFKGASSRGLYGDVIEEIDWSVGEIINALDRLGLSENTFVIFTSDNGPWMIEDQRGGTAGMLRGEKAETWEGGMRVPFIARWPGMIPQGVVSQAVGSVLDFFPTCVALAGGTVPNDRPLDGINLMPALTSGEEPLRTLYYYYKEQLQAVRHGKWKLHFCYHDMSIGNRHVAESWITPERPLLFDLEVDPSERFDLAADNPEIVAKLVKIAEDYKMEIARLDENRELKDWFLSDKWVDKSTEPDPL